MASVTSTQVVSDIAEPNGWRWVRYRFDILDNLGGNHIEYMTKKISPSTDVEVDMAAMIPQLLDSLKLAEQENWRSQCSDGDDPLHIDNGGFFSKSTPLWGSWDEMFTAVAKWFFSRENQLELVPYNDSWGRVSNTDKRNNLGITNQDVTDMGGQVQVAVNTKATLDTYVPLFDEYGNLR